MKRSTAVFFAGIILGFLVSLPTVALASGRISIFGRTDNAQLRPATTQPSSDMVKECKLHMENAGSGMDGMMAHDGKPS